MKLKTLIIVAAGALLPAACNDAIQFPGMQKNDSTEPAGGPDGAQPAEPASGATETESSASTETGSADNTEAALPSGDMTSPGGDQPDPVETVMTLPASLGEINATICAATTAETLTIAQITGARDPVDAMVGTATVNGAIARRTDFPGIVKMEPKTDLVSGGISSGHCSATRIAEHWFVTAAHCLDEQYDRVELIAGSDTLTSPLAKHVLASTSICHKSYGGSQSQYANDIALVRVGDAALADLSDVPIARFGRSQLPLGPSNYETADMAGWGLTGFDQSLSNDLLTARLTLAGAGPAIINVASRDGAGPCVGDSGGPLYVTETDGTKTVVGVLSVVEQNRATGEFCAGEYNGRYTNLQGFSDWINSVISVCDASAGLCEMQP